MTVLTTTPGMQLYTANFLSPRTGKGGAQYQEGGAVCLETQFYPDAIHHANFPSPVLRARERLPRDHNIALRVNTRISHL